MDENKKEVKKLEEKVEKVAKTEEKKVAEVKKEEPKFEKVSKKEADKISKTKSKENKKEKNKNAKTDKKKNWVPTAIVAIVVIAIIAVLTVMIVVSSDPKKSLDGLLTNLRSGNFEKAQEYLSGDETELTDTSLDEEALNAAKEAIGSGNAENISEQDFQQYFLEELKNEEIQTTTNEKTINAVKVDNKWKIVSDDDLVSAILPGLEEAINTLS